MPPAWLARWRPGSRGRPSRSALELIGRDGALHHPVRLLAVPCRRTLAETPIRGAFGEEVITRRLHPTGQVDRHDVLLGLVDARAFQGVLRRGKIAVWLTLRSTSP